MYEMFDLPNTSVVTISTMRVDEEIPYIDFATRHKVCREDQDFQDVHDEIKKQEGRAVEIKLTGRLNGKDIAETFSSMPAYEEYLKTQHVLDQAATPRP